MFRLINIFNSKIKKILIYRQYNTILFIMVIHYTIEIIKIKKHIYYPRIFHLNQHISD